MSLSRNRQQRLFTGALFPEALNEQLFAFASRHRLHSNVWVPRRAFDVALKPYNIFILPNAALCDVSLTPGGGGSGASEAIGTDCVLVNAQQTSNQRLLEEFRDFLMSRLTTPTPLPTIVKTSFFGASFELSGFASQVGTDPAGPDHRCFAPTRNSFEEEVSREREYFTAADQHAWNARRDAADNRIQSMRPQQPVVAPRPDPLWDALPPFQYPLALNGSLLLGTDVSVLLLQWQKEHRVFTNYWRRLRNRTERQHRFVNVGNSEYPGRYNPFFCVRYVPHNYIGCSFPVDIARLMRHRAVEHGYVSRLWLTARQGEELFGATLHPERAHDFPTVYSTYHTGGLECLEYYCADQFDRAAELFPTRHEIDLAAKGVRISSAKIAAFPLLKQLQNKYGIGASSESGDGRSGMDVVMQDANRHSEFCRMTEVYSSIRLIGFDSKKKMRYLQNTHMDNLLRRKCILSGYPSPTFISHRTLTKLELPLRGGEEGVAQMRTPVRLPFDNAWTNGECWFNVAQMREPAIGDELLERWPLHFLTRCRFSGPLAVQCCHLQIAARTCAAALPSVECESATPAAPVSATSEWVPLYVLKLAGWKLRQGAAGVRYNPYILSASFKPFTVGANVLFRLEDVELDARIAAWMRRYTPVDAKGYPYLRGLRQLLTLRAYERAYQSHVWLSFREGAATAQRLQLRPTPRPIRAGIAALDTTAYSFGSPPFVCFRQLVFVNEEEVVGRAWETASHSSGEKSRAAREPDASLQSMNEKVRDMVMSGIGISAEAFMTRRARAGKLHAYRVADGFLHDDECSSNEGVDGNNDD